MILINNMIRRKTDHLKKNNVKGGEGNEENSFKNWKNIFRENTVQY